MESFNGKYSIMWIEKREREILTLAPLQHLWHIALTNSQFSSVWILLGRLTHSWAPSEVLTITTGWGQLRLCKRWRIFGGIPMWFLGLAFATCCHCHCCLQLLHILFHKRRYFQGDNWDCSCHGGDLYKIDDRTLSKQGFEEMLRLTIEACVWLNGLSPCLDNRDLGSCIDCCVLLLRSRKYITWLHNNLQQILEMKFAVFFPFWFAVYFLASISCRLYADP